MKDIDRDLAEITKADKSINDVKLLEIANKYDLLISGGSDYHGKTIKPDIELGTGKNNGIRIKKLSLLDKLNK